jgi:hypothetical protein
MIAVHFDSALLAFGATASCAIIAQKAAETEVLKSLKTTPSLSGLWFNSREHFITPLITARRRNQIKRAASDHFDRAAVLMRCGQSAPGN